MSDEKRTYKSETIDPTTMRLTPIMSKQDDLQRQPLKKLERRKSIFTPELISRLTERIKKL
jgi:hypothetical protein